MKVIALKSFVGLYENPDGTRAKLVVEEGQEFDQPIGVDWQDAGLTKPLEPEKKTTRRKATRRKATRAPKETAVKE
jgi:hypothetical protein